MQLDHDSGTALMISNNVWLHPRFVHIWSEYHRFMGRCATTMSFPFKSVPRGTQRR